MSKSKGLFRSHLNDKTFEEILKGIDKDAVLVSWSPLDGIKGTGFVSKVSAGNEIENDKLVGLFSFEIKYKLQNNGDVLSKIIVLKSKATGKEVIASFANLIPQTEREFYEIFKKYAIQLELSNAEYRELECVQVNDKILKSIMPETYWSWADPDQDIFVFAMEYLNSENVSHLDAIDDVYLWKEKDILDALEYLALFHSRFYNNTNALPEKLRKHIDISYKDRLMNLKPLWEACMRRNFKTGFWNKVGLDLGIKLLDNLPEICDILDAAPKTFIHNDINIMNVCLRKHTTPGKLRLCLFDWEDCSIGPPQHDVGYFLCFILPQNTELAVWNKYIEKYYSFLVLYLSPDLLQNNGALTDQIQRLSNLVDGTLADPIQQQNHSVDGALADQIQHQNYPIDGALVAIPIKQQNNHVDGAHSNLMQKQLQQKRGINGLEFEEFKKVFDMCICEMYINRNNWACSTLGAVYKPVFVPRLISNMVQYITQVVDKYHFK